MLPLFRMRKSKPVLQPGRVPGTRELIVVDTPYIIPYRVIEDRVRLLRVLHGAQLWPEPFSG